MLQKEQFEELAEARMRYEEDLIGLDRVPGAKKEHITESFRTVKPLYTPLDIEGTDYLRDIGFPGQYPYTRGVFPAGFRTRLPSIRQVIGLEPLRRLTPGGNSSFHRVPPLSPWWESAGRA